MQYSSNPNLVEGREFWSPGGIALDLSTTPPGLYVSDTSNNRVLGWRNAASFSNGAYADIVVGQPEGAFALATTNPEGPCWNSQQTRGLRWPTGMAVDKSGNLYVVDAGNNRILRYPTPFAAGSPGMNPDVVIGQPDYNSCYPNQGGGAIPSSTSISPLVSNSPPSQALVFDGSGNLWYADSGNHRVLRYPVGSGGKVQGTADTVLGQADFVHAVELPATNVGFTNLGGFRFPTGLAIDASGRIWVSDALARVLVFQSSPPPTGNLAMAMLGQVVLQTGQQPPATPNATQFGYPTGLAWMGSNLAVMDAAVNRITIFAALDAWLANYTPNTSSPAAVSVIGQTSFSTNIAGATASGLHGPVQAAFSGTELFVVDSGNNRVVVFPPPAIPQMGATATRELGQRDFGYYAPNWIEGRELYLGGSGGVVVDPASTPPRLYIADTYNNRVLGYADARNVHPGDTANLAIGQPDLFSSGINGPVNDPKQPSATGLYSPVGMAVDANGNLYVADRDNGRVLRFPKPFAQPNPFSQTANLVLGKSDFTTANYPDVNDRNMYGPYGLAFTTIEGDLLVSDNNDNRTLLFKLPQGGDFSSGQPADGVLGQPNFFTANTALGLPDRMVAPRGIGTDTSGRLYVADTGNNRILVYGSTTSYGSSGGPEPVLSITNSTSTTLLKSPLGVVVSPTDGTIWVAETLGGTNQNGRILEYPEFVTTSLTPYPILILPTVTNPLAVALDMTPGLGGVPAGNLLVAEAANRVSFYFPPLWVTSALNFLPNIDKTYTYGQPCCAPGSWASVWSAKPLPNNNFGSIATAVYSSNPPFPTTLGDIQVLVGGVPAPLWFVGSGQINFQVPTEIPTSGPVDVLVEQASTGQVLAWSIGAPFVNIGTVAPALNLWLGYPTGAANAIQVIAQQFTDSPPSCNGQNGPSSAGCPGGVRPANRGEVITLYATGQGQIDGMPGDGAASSGQLVPKPRVWMGTSFVDDANVSFSGLAPSLVGVWQINVQVPTATAPGPVWIMLWYGDKFSSLPSNPPSTSNPSYPFSVIQVK